MPSTKIKDFQFIRRTAEDGYTIKVPVFSFDKFPNVDKSLGPEAACAFRYGARRMKSTGEAIYFIKDLKEEPAPHVDAGFCHCEVRLCGPWQRQVYGSGASLEFVDCGIVSIMNKELVLRTMCVVIAALTAPVVLCQLTYENGKALVDTVIEVDTVPSDVLYERAKEWMLRNMKSADNQVSLDDEAKARLIGTTNLLLPKKKYGNIGSYYVERVLNFKLSVFLKEGRYRVIVENIAYSCVLTNGVHRAPEQATMEEYFENRKKFESEGKKKRFHEITGTIEDLEGEISKLLTSLHGAMLDEADGKDKDW